MTSLENTANLLKKSLPIVGFLLVIIILIALIAIKYTQKDPEPQEPQTPYSLPQIKTFPATASGFNVQNVNLPQNYPKSLPAYEYIQPKNLLENASLYAQRLNFAAEPVKIGSSQTEEGLIYSQENKILGVYPNSVSYQSSLPLTQSIQTEENELIKKTQDFLENFDFQTSLENPHVIYTNSAGETESQVQSKSEANIVSFNFAQNLQGFEIAGGNQVHISFTGNGEIVDFNLHPLQINQPTTAYKIVQPQKALDQIRQNQGFLINIEGDREDIEAITKLGPVMLTEGTLAYYLPSEKQELIQPIWLFKGSAQIQDLELDLEYAVPAFESSITL